jgi:hypothetical protein
MLKRRLGSSDLQVSALGLLSRDQMQAIEACFGRTPPAASPAGSV